MASTSHVSSSVTYGGSTWILLCSSASWYVDSDEGTQSLWGVSSVIKNVKSKISTSYATGDIKNVTVGASVRGDILVMPFNGYSADRGYTAQVAMTFRYGTGPRAALSNKKVHVARWTSYQKITIGKQNAVSIPTSTQTPSFGTWASGSTLDDGDFGISYTCYDFAWGHNDCGVDIWVKNLWFDTTGSMVMGL